MADLLPLDQGRLYHRLAGLSILLSVAGAAAWGQETTFRSTVPLVLVPVTVTDARGRFVDGLAASDFRLLDGGVPRPFQLDTAESVSAPLALVIAVQVNDLAAPALLKIRKTGALVQPLITGERGHAAVLTYGSRVQRQLDFTSDPEKIAAALGAIRNEGAREAHAVDAIAEAVAMLAKRPKGERRVVLVIGESKDRGSETKIGDVILDIQRTGVTVFAANYSAWKTPFTTKASELPRSGGSSMDLLAGLSELIRAGKASTTETLARESGGRVLSFNTLRGLEQLLTRVGEEIHSQYLLSAPAMSEPEGFHAIEVRVEGRGGAQVHARQGYWAVH